LNNLKKKAAGILVFLSVLLIVSCTETEEAFKGHDLPRLRGVMSNTRMEEDDIRRLGLEWGVNLIRYQMMRDWHAVDGNRDLDEYNRWVNGHLDKLEEILKYCKKYGIYVVVDLHELPGGRYENRDMAMFYEKEYADAFIRTWEKIAHRLKGKPMIWAYDLVNEPVHSEELPEGMDNFLGLQVKATRAIRAIDAETPIMITSDDWSRPRAFNYMTTIDMPKIIYQAHMYEPLNYTYQEADGPAKTYPGNIDGKVENKETLREYLQPVRDFQLAHNVHIYIGEFSAFRWAPGAETYLDDLISIFEEYCWDWSYHAYREAHVWDLEYTENRNKKEKATEPTARMKVLRKWWAKNERAH
jgi:aryl-phospho-beta-D-glucosidase BglC (GH1 family)